MSTRMCILDILAFIVDGGKLLSRSPPKLPPPPHVPHAQRLPPSPWILLPHLHCPPPRTALTTSSTMPPPPCLPNHCPPPFRVSARYRARKLPATLSHTSTDGGHQDPQNQNLVPQPETINCQSYWRSPDMEKNEISIPEEVCIPTLKNLSTDE